jgi:hypothetical protein
VLVPAKGEPIRTKTSAAASANLIEDLPNPMPFEIRTLIAKPGMHVAGVHFSCLIPYDQLQTRRLLDQSSGQQPATAAASRALTRFPKAHSDSGISEILVDIFFVHEGSFSSPLHPLAPADSSLFRG